MRTVVMNNALANAYAAQAVAVSVHSADPGTSGTSQVAGTTRFQVVWNPAQNGKVSTREIAVSVPAGATVTHVGIWSATSGGSFLDSHPVAPTDFAEAGYFVTYLTYTQEN